MRYCPFDGCPRVIGDDKFACPPHWFSLNGHQQTRIWDAYRAYLADALSMDSLKAIQQEVLDEVQGARKP